MNRKGVVYHGARALWHAVNPHWLRLLTRAERARAHLRASPTKWLRQNWPKREMPQAARHVAIVTVNFNTARYLALLAFSLFRVLGRDQFSRLVIVDNASTDESPELLRALRDAGLADVIFNQRQRYHGPGLNQAMNYLAALSRQARSAEESIDAVWILDSDTIVLRRHAVSHAVAALENSRAALLGEFGFDELPEGYAHLSTMLIDPTVVWRRGIDVFQEHGTPARELHMCLRRRGLPICNFPYRSANYMLHLGCATLRSIHEADEMANRYRDWAAQHQHHHYHGNPHGEQLFGQMADLFAAEVPRLSGAALVEACTSRVRLRLRLPGPTKGAYCGVDTAGAGRNLGVEWTEK